MTDVSATRSSTSFSYDTYVTLEKKELSTLANRKEIGFIRLNRESVVHKALCLYREEMIPHIGFDKCFPARHGHPMFLSTKLPLELGKWHL